ncbi:putative Ig domain-containing protein [bacterium]|nr:putative Ig domain-containing protein [bacterium]
MKKSLKKISKITLSLFLFLAVGFLLSSSNNFNIFNYKTYTVSAQVNADAIGIRVIPNPGHLDPQVWYNRNFFTGSPSRMKVDGYEAIRDGRSVYVNVGNEINPTTLETYIYIISYNQDVEPVTVAIYEQMLDNWKFNTNINDFGICGISSIICKSNEECSSDYECLNDKCAFPAGDEPACHIDPDCPDGIFCNSQKARVTRDVKRLAELTLIEERLAEYRNAKGQYPVLSSGSYLPYKTISTWPSWQDELGRMLGMAIPVDPVNALGDCGSDNYSPVTCWDKDAISFAGDLVTTPYDFLGGRIYFYNTTDPYNYELCAAMETAGSPYTNLDSSACSSLSIANGAPNLTVGALNGHPSSPFTAYAAYSDPEGDAYNVSSLGITAISAWGGAPLSLTASTSNLLKIYTPSADLTVGSYDFSITVADIYGATTIRTITINLGNQTPVIDLSSCSTVNAINQFYSCDFNMFDPDGDTIMPTLVTPLPAGIVVDFASSTISGIPTAAGTFPVTITVSDFFSTATGTYQLMIANKVCGDGILDNPIPNDFGVIETCDGPGGGTGPNDQYGCSANCLSWQGGYCGDSATQYLEGEQCDYNLTPANVNAMRNVISYWQGSTTPIDRLPIYRIRNIYQDNASTRCQNDCTFACSLADLTTDTDADIYNQCFDNCPGMSNIGQFDADQDNVGDLCDLCYSYNGACVELEVAQGAWSTTIVPYVGQRNSEDFYCYSGNCNACTDADPYTLCSTAAASSNMTAYEITSSDRSEIFAYIDSSNPFAPMLSLGFVHDIPSDIGGGRAFFDFSGNGWTSATISVQDDNASEFSKTLVPPGRWTWMSCCTDGGMIDVDYLNNGWNLTISPNPGFTSNDGGTTVEWFAKEPGGVLSGTTLPSTSTPVTITYIPN